MERRSGKTGIEAGTSVSMIQSLEEAASALLRKRSAQAAKDFRSSVRPIYRQGQRLVAVLVAQEST